MAEIQNLSACEIPIVSTPPHLLLARPHTHTCVPNAAVPTGVRVRVGGFVNAEHANRRARPVIVASSVCSVSNPSSIHLSRGSRPFAAATQKGEVSRFLCRTRLRMRCNHNINNNLKILVHARCFSRRRRQFDVISTRRAVSENG